MKILMLCVPDEIVIGFFSAVVVSMAAAIAILWNNSNSKEKRHIDRSNKKEDEGNL